MVEAAGCGFLLRSGRLSTGDKNRNNSHDSRLLERESGFHSGVFPACIARNRNPTSAEIRRRMDTGGYDARIEGLGRALLPWNRAGSEVKSLDDICTTQE
jgi:hypothetical protein